MDSENPRGDEHMSPTGSYQTTPSPAAPSAALRASHPPETAFAFEAASFAASTTATSDALRTRAVVYPSGIEPPDADAPVIAPPDDQPVIVPVLSAQHVTQPFLRSDAREERDFDEPADDESHYRWPDDEDSDEDSDEDKTPDDDDEFDFGFDVDSELINIPNSISGQVFTRDDAFALRERNRDGWKQLRKTALVLLSLVLMLTIAAFGAAIAASYLHRATDHLAIPVSVPTTSSYSNGVVVQPGSEGIAPTPVAPKYQIGAWMSNNAPGGGSVKVFVRLTEDVAPIPQIPVTLSVQMPGGSVVKLGPTNTDGYGLATFTVKFGGTRGVPIFVTASATVGDENLSADTVFVPA